MQHGLRSARISTSEWTTGGAVVHRAIAARAAALEGSDIVQWFTTNLVPLILLAVGVELLLRKGDKSENTETASNVVLGCLVVVGAVCFYGFSDELHSLPLGG